jgi:hypothetical protein
MTVNAKIAKADYNTIRTKVVDVLGVGSIDYGYGQTVRSSAVDESNKVTVNEWGNLYYDIVNCFVHQTGAGPASATLAVDGSVIKHSTDITTITAERSGTNLLVYQVASGMLAVDQTISGTGIVGTPVITAASGPLTVTVTHSAVSPPTVTGTGPYSVTYTIPVEPLAPPVALVTGAATTGAATSTTSPPVAGGISYVIAGNSNPTFNGTFIASASTTTSITLRYQNDPLRTVSPTYATNLSVTARAVYDAAGGLSAVGPNGIFTGKSIFYLTASDYNTAITSGRFSIGDGISGTGIPSNTHITAIASAKTVIGSDEYYAITINNSFSATQSGTVLLSVGSADTRLKLSSTVGIETGMTISGTGFSTQTVSSILNATIIILSAAPSTTPSGTITFRVPYGSGTTTLASSPTSNPWGRNIWTLNTSQTLSSRSLTAENTATTHPITQYDTFANTIRTNRFDVGAGQSFTTTKGTVSETWPGTYGASWNTTIKSTIRVQFTSAANARHFFNSGGEIRFNSSRTGSTARAQDLAWTTLLTTAATKAFGGNKPTIGVGALNGTNFYRLTSTFQEWTFTSYSSPYTANKWSITARCRDVANNSLGTSADIEFQSEWIDGYVDPGNFPLDVPQDVDKVTGTISLTVTTLEATGILQPSGAGTFVVESPIVTISAITP